MRAAVNQQRMVSEFLELTRVDAVTYREREIADILKEKLKGLGFTVTEDDAGEKLGGNAGNLYAFLPGEGEPVLFSGHMDTVSPGLGKKPQLQGDRIVSDGRTVLGSDDIAGVVEILEAVRLLQENNLSHRPIELLLAVAEEVYCKGTEVFDYSRIRSKEGYVLDISGDVGAAAVAAPSVISFTVTVTGRAAHAGFAPEEGIHAITAAAKGIAALRQGHIDGETICNIGRITGGEASNIVPAKCSCVGEIRSMSHQKALAQLEEVRRVFGEAAAEIGAEAAVDSRIDLIAYQIGPQEPPVAHFRAACEKLGLPGTLLSTFGGADNHHFVEHGIRGIVLSSGMEQVHTTAEYVRVDQLVKGAELVAELMQSR
jgi:tripeptide aminopeptidase